VTVPVNHDTADGGEDLFWYWSPGDDSVWWHKWQIFDWAGLD
jgi:hypothetical protein